MEGQAGQGHHLKPAILLFVRRLVPPAHPPDHYRTPFWLGWAGAIDPRQVPKMRGVSPRVQRRTMTMIRAITAMEGRPATRRRGDHMRRGGGSCRAARNVEGGRSSVTRSEWTHPMCVRFPCGQWLERRWSVDEWWLILYRTMHPAVGSGAVSRGRNGEFVVSWDG
jgi:hypothetical protein